MPQNRGNLFVVWIVLAFGLASLVLPPPRAGASDPEIPIITPLRDAGGHPVHDAAGNPVFEYAAPGERGDGFTKVSVESSNPDVVAPGTVKIYQGNSHTFVTVPFNGKVPGVVLVTVTLQNRRTGQTRTYYGVVNTDPKIQVVSVTAQPGNTPGTMSIDVTTKDAAGTHALGFIARAPESAPQTPARSPSPSPSPNPATPGKPENDHGGGSM